MYTHRSAANAPLPVQRAFTHAFEEVFGLRDLSIDVITHHGLTDPLVAQRTLVFAGVSAEDAEARWPEVAASMLRYAESHTADAGSGLEVLPGVAALLSALRERGAAVGLVTGNLTMIAWAKMEALSLAQLFTEPRFGGFGTDHSDRGELVRIAGQRARLLAPGIRAVWHVGDTVRLRVLLSSSASDLAVPVASLLTSVLLHTVAHKRSVCAPAFSRTRSCKRRTRKPRWFQIFPIWKSCWCSLLLNRAHTEERSRRLLERCTGIGALLQRCKELRTFRGSFFG